MPLIQILALIAQYGPSILPLVHEVMTWSESGKKTVTAADIQTLIDLGKRTSADYLKEQGIKIVDGKVVPITNDLMLFAQPPPTPPPAQ